MDEGTGPTCPECKKPIKTRKRGACPLCGTALMLYKGFYYREEQGTPTLAILAAFERYVSQQLSKKQGKVIPFHISKKTPQYRRELVECERLLKTCDGDLDLALLALEVAFGNQQFSWKNWFSISAINSTINVVLAVALAVKEERDQKEAQNVSVADELSSMEDLFG